MLKPKVFIETKWESTPNFFYKQPKKYCNGKELTSKMIQNFEDIWGVPFSKVCTESAAYNNALTESQYNSTIWTNQKQKEKAFKKIYEFNKAGKSGYGSSTTPLLPFEIHLMNDNFEMIRFVELNAINPMDRCYKKENTVISVCFGIKVISGGEVKKQVNFYFQIANNNKIFQVDNNIDNYNKAINGKLNPI